MKNLFYLIIFIACFHSCKGAKYTTTFERGKSLNFSHGKWLLNDVIETNKSHAFDISLKKFKEIIHGEVYKVDEALRLGSGLMSSNIPFNPTKEEMLDIKKATLCDYLINIKSRVLSDQMSGFVGSAGVGAAIRENAASTTIRIFDLNRLELISEATISGRDKRILSEEFDYGRSTSVSAIKQMGAIRLINQYNKNRLDKK